MYSVLIVQMGNNYFWVLQREGKWLATSERIAPKEGIVEEAEGVAKDLKIDNIYIDERK